MLARGLESCRISFSNWPIRDRDGPTSRSSNLPGRDRDGACQPPRSNLPPSRDREGVGLLATLTLLCKVVAQVVDFSRDPSEAD